MAGYTKLFSSIVTSSIWREDNVTRIIWVTMLALADATGRVDAAVPGLAAAANVDVDECERALAKLLSPDKYSRTKDHDGRRIEECEGGWAILNYAYYREKGRTRDRTDYMRQYQRNRRRRKQCKPVSTRVDRSNPIAEAEAEEVDTPGVVSTWESATSEDSLSLAALLRDLIVGRLPKSRARRANLQAWAAHVDKLIRIDGHTPTEIEQIIRFSQADSFWQDNILSTAKLRTKFDNLQSKMQKETSDGTGRRLDRNYSDRPSDFGDEIIV